MQLRPYPATILKQQPTKANYMPLSKTEFFLTYGGAIVALYLMATAFLGV